jgi:nitrile hydratase alpha subunit
MSESSAETVCAAPLRRSLRAEEALVIEDDAGNAAGDRLVRALQSLLIDKGLISPREVEAEIARIEAPGLHLGARIVARAWVDPAFRERLLADGKEGAAELGIKIGEAQLVVVENTPTDHNLIVCTLCSCYPRSLLGQPPSWYISKTFRARTVREPRTVLREFGLDVPPGVRVRVHDSNADMRYLVLPLRPDGTEGWDEAALVGLVTRDTLIGTAIAVVPEVV